VTRQVIILNCPPNSGKDTVADYIQETYGCDHLRFKTYLYEITAKLFVMELEELIEMVEDKEMPLNSYTWTHGEAKLSDAQIQSVINWAQAVRVKYGLEPKPE